MGEQRISKISNSWGVYDAYKAIRKQKWMNIGRAITEKQFYAIIRRLNEEIARQLLEGRKISLPAKFGWLFISKRENTVYLKDGKIKSTYPVDWKSTLELWKDSEEARQDKTLIRYKNQYTYKITYNKYKATYNNKIFYMFSPMRELKVRLKEKINNQELDVLW